MLSARFRTLPWKGFPPCQRVRQFWRRSPVGSLYHFGYGLPHQDRPHLCHIFTRESEISLRGHSAKLSGERSVKGPMILLAKRTETTTLIMMAMARMPNAILLS